MSCSCAWLYTVSPAAAGGGPASSANLLEQKLVLEISLLRKHNRLLNLQEKCYFQSRRCLKQDNLLSKRILLQEQVF